MEHPTSRAEAQRLGATHYFTGVPCKQGHVALRKTKGACVECLKVEAKAALVGRAEYFAAYNKSAAGKAAKDRYYAANKDAVIARAALRPDEVKRLHRKNWKANHKTSTKLHVSIRRKRNREATPRWLTKTQRAAIKQLYLLAMESTRITGNRYVVDHIVPLQSPLVCGLHVPWNLRVLTQRENALKYNTLPEDRDAVAFPRGR